MFDMAIKWRSGWHYQRLNAFLAFPRCHKALEKNQPYSFSRKSKKKNTMAHGVLNVNQFTVSDHYTMRILQLRLAAVASQFRQMLERASGGCMHLARRVQLPPLQFSRVTRDKCVTPISRGGGCHFSFSNRKERGWSMNSQATPPSNSPGGCCGGRKAWDIIDPAFHGSPSGPGWNKNKT